MGVKAIFILRSRSSRSSLTIQRRKHWAENSWEFGWLQFFEFTYINIYPPLLIPAVSEILDYFLSWKFTVRAVPVCLCSFCALNKTRELAVSRCSGAVQKEEEMGQWFFSLCYCSQPPNGILLLGREYQPVSVF